MATTANAGLGNMFFSVSVSPIPFLLFSPFFCFFSVVFYNFFWSIMARKSCAIPVTLKMWTLVVVSDINE